MKEILKPKTDERPFMIYTGIIVFYALIAGFILYLYFLHRISLTWMLILLTGVTLVYIPRFIILNKISNKDKIEITDTHIVINGNAVRLNIIEDFHIKKQKPQVVFFMNNKMVVFQQAQFDLKLPNGVVSFSAIGTEKISLLEDFFNELLLMEKHRN